MDQSDYHGVRRNSAMMIMSTPSMPTQTALHGTTDDTHATEHTDTDKHGRLYGLHALQSPLNDPDEPLPGS